MAAMYMTKLLCTW